MAKPISFSKADRRNVFSLHLWANDCCLHIFITSIFLLLPTKPASDENIQIRFFSMISGTIGKKKWGIWRVIFKNIKNETVELWLATAMCLLKSLLFTVVCLRTMLNVSYIFHWTHIKLHLCDASMKPIGWCPLKGVAGVWAFRKVALSSSFSYSCSHLSSTSLFVNSCWNVSSSCLHCFFNSCLPFSI